MPHGLALGRITVRQNRNTLGNLVNDDSRQLDTLKYDYRNLMTYAEAAPSYSGRPDTWLQMEYDQVGKRISKVFKYEESYSCLPIPMGPVRGPMKPQGLCYGNKYQKRYYLWDEGVLLAVFDNSDNVIELFTNGSEGRIATYVLNDDDKLHFFVNDQIGSERVAMHAEPNETTYMSEYINNHLKLG